MTDVFGALDLGWWTVGVLVVCFQFGDKLGIYIGKCLSYQVPCQSSGFGNFDRGQFYCVLRHE